MTLAKITTGPYKDHLMLRMIGAAIAALFASNLIKASKWFVMTPLPGDEWEFIVKDEPGIVTPERDKFLVTSYYSDENQSLYDFVQADDADEAAALVGRARDYVTGIVAWTATELRECADRLDADMNPPRTALELRKQLGEETDDWCLMCDSDDCCIAEHAKEVS